MSQFNLLEDANTNQPLPNIPFHTMLLIETNNFLPAPQPSQPHIEHHHNIRPPPPLKFSDDEELSLEVALEQNKHPVMTPKKKKTGCTCKKTKCLKMYCECFANGKHCGEDCACQGCSNDEAHQKAIDRARDLIRVKNGSSKTGSVGCNCRKTQCLKKYCECFNAGVACGEKCKCEDCCNTKEGCSIARMKDGSWAQTRQTIGSNSIMKPIV